MSLIEQLQQDMKSALKNKEKEKLATIRLVRAAIKRAEIDNQGPLNEDQVLDVILREVKQRREAIQEYEKAHRQDLVEKEKAQLAVLESYLPKQLTEEELEQLLRETIEELGVTSKKEIGKVMKTVMPKVKGRADGKVVNQLAQKLLN